MVCQATKPKFMKDHDTILPGPRAACIPCAAIHGTISPRTMVGQYRVENNRITTGFEASS